MGKSAIRILPPLVHGKLSGLLEFEVDYVEITEKIFKNENCNFLVQIIWWGETKPLFLRPKKCKFITKNNRQVIVDGQDGCAVKYEVRTKIKLFKSYLTKCEEVELTVLDSVKNEVIGSTFLKDLIYLVYKDEYFTNPVINDSGDAIGKITCYFKFCEVDSINQSDKALKIGIDQVPVEKWNNNDLKINLNLTGLYLSRDNLYESNRTDRGNGSGRSVNVHYNSPVARISGLTCDDSQKGRLTDCKVKTCSINADSDHSEKSQRELDLGAENEIKCADSGNATSETAKRDDKKEIKAVTPIQAKTSTAEVITSRIRNSGLKQSPKVVNKKVPVRGKLPKNRTATARGLKKDKRNVTEAVNVRNSGLLPKCNKTSLAKPIGNIKTFGKVSKEVSKLSKRYLNGEVHGNHSDVENVPVKENVKVMVEDNAAVTNNIPITSPTEPSKSTEDEVHIGNDKTGRERVNVNNKLFFDLNDPIEKLYYETFFEKTEALCNDEFEIAELLNQPGNNYVPETNSRDVGGRAEKHSVENKIEGCINVRRRSLSPVVDVRRNERSCNNGDEAVDGFAVSDGKGCDHESAKSKEYTIDCHRCKYHKKLSELDKIIESLKNFEARLRTDDGKNVIHECGPTLPADTVLENENTENSEQGDIVVNASESDYSKEDSDFIEFRRYLSTR